MHLEYLDLSLLWRVAEVIRKEFSISHPISSLSGVLHRMGFSPQKPKRRAAERNLEAVQTWLKENGKKIELAGGGPKASWMSVVSVLRHWWSEPGDSLERRR